MNSSVRQSVLRNCVHGSEIVLIRVDDGEGNPTELRKSSSTPEGVRNLQSEKLGYEWYLSRSGGSKPFNVRLFESARYARLHIPYVVGKKYFFYEGLLKNRRAIETVIQHYVKVWGQHSGTPERAPLHGDLSIDNILFPEGETPFLLDWEHFSSDSAPIGFDALYLLFESLWFEKLGSSAPSPEVLNFISEQILYLRNRGCLSRIFSERPLGNLVRFMNENSNLWGDQIQKFKKKFPILGWSDSWIAEVDRLFQTRMNR